MAFDGHDDRLNRQTQITDPRLSITKTEYDEAGNVKKLTAPGNFGASIVNLTEYTYDDLNRLKTEKKTNLPGSPTATNVYDARGNLVSQTNLKGQATAFVYDAFDRKLSENRPTDDGTVEKLRFGYEADNQMVYAENERTGSFWNSRSIIRYQYAADPLRRLKETNSTVIVSGTSAPVTSIIVRSYEGSTNDLDKIDVLGGSTALPGYTVNYTYDSLGRLIAEDIPSGAKFAWNAAGQLQWVQRAYGANKLDTVYGYDLAGRLTSLRHETPGTFGPTSQGAYQYQYDAVDRVTWKQYKPTAAAASQIDKYSYDQADQLVSAAHDYQANEAYTYDANGNRTGGGQAYSQGYDRLTADGTYTYQYDNEGNLKKRVKLADNSRTEYYYDADNRLLEVFDWVPHPDTVTYPNGFVTQFSTYVYDAFGRQVARWVDADGWYTTLPLAIETYTLDGDDLLSVRDAAGAITHRYLNGPLVDQVLIDDKIVNNAGGSARTQWLLADEQQTTRKLLQPGVSTPLAEFTYNSFGKLTSATSPDDVDLFFGHAGGWHEHATGLTKRGERYYDAETGRFLTEDPAEADVNPYRYAGNDPINYVDPTGLTRSGNSTSLGGGTSSNGSYGGPNIRGGSNFGYSSLTPTSLLSGGSSFGLGSLNATPAPKSAPAPVPHMPIPLVNFDVNDPVARARNAAEMRLDYRLPPGSAERAFRDSLAVGPERMMDGAGRLIQQTAYMGRDIAMGATETGLRVVSNTTGWFEAPRFNDISAMALNNPVNSPNFVGNSFKNAGRAGLAGFTLGSSEIAIGTYQYTQTGDAVAFQEHIGGVAFGNVAAAGMMRGSQVYGRGTQAPKYASQVKVGKYLAGEAPQQVQPGVRVLTGSKIESSGAAPRVQPWTAHYDQYGRLIGRTDFNAANPAVGIPDVHYHTFQWGRGMNPLETGSHIPGQFGQ